MPDADRPALEIDRPDILAEVHTAFTAYERALVAHDVEVLDAAFWDDPRVIRFGIADAQCGPDEIARWRSDAGPVPGDRVLRDVQITAFGDDLAIVWTHFSDALGGIGRQSQVWARVDGAWHVVAAHVSRVEHESTSG